MKTFKFTILGPVKLSSPQYLPVSASKAPNHLAQSLTLRKSLFDLKSEKIPSDETSTKEGDLSDLSSHKEKNLLFQNSIRLPNLTQFKSVLPNSYSGTKKFSKKKHKQKSKFCGKFVVRILKNRINKYKNLLRIDTKNIKRNIHKRSASLVPMS